MFELGLRACYVSGLQICLFGGALARGSLHLAVQLVAVVGFVLEEFVQSVQLERGRAEGHMCDAHPCAAHAEEGQHQEEATDSGNYKHLCSNLNSFLLVLLSPFQRPSGDSVWQDTQTLSFN